MQNNKAGVKTERENRSAGGPDSILEDSPDKLSDNGPGDSADAWDVPGNRTEDGED